MMGRWVLSGAFLIYFLFPCSLVQEHTPTVQNTDMSEGPSFYPKFQMSSYTPRDISSQLPQEPAWNLAFQMGQSPLVTSRTPMQSSPSVREQKVHWQESQGSSIESSIQMQPGPVMNPGLPTLRRPSGHPSHQSPSRPSSRSGFHVPIGPLVESDKYGKKQTGPVAPRKPRMEKRTQYSTKQKSVLQECFAECQYPDQKLCMELASLVGVTEKEIKVCLSLYPQSHSKNIHFPIRYLNFVLLKCMGQCGQFGWWIFIHASNAVPHILHQLDTNRDENDSPPGS